MAHRAQSTKKAPLELTAPKDVLRGGKMMVQAELDLTWRQFLGTDLQLAVTSDMYVCTATYSVNHPPGVFNSWRFELDEKIGDFIAKFERRRTQYAVNIRRSQHGRGMRYIQRYSSYRNVQLGATRAPSVAGSIFRRRLRGPPAKSTRSALQKLKRRVPLKNGANNAAAQQTSSAGNSGSQGAPQPTSTVNVRIHMPPPPPPARRQVPVQLPRQNEEAPGFSGAAGNGNPANQLVPLVTRRGAEFNELNDGLSVVTSATAEERELRLQAIKPEDIRAQFEEKVLTLPNNFILRMRQEFRLLHSTGRWWNAVQRTPLACHFLQKVFDLE